MPRSESQLTPKCTIFADIGTSKIFNPLKLDASHRKEIYRNKGSKMSNKVYTN